MRIVLLSVTFSSSFAPAGIGKVVINPSTVTVRPGLEELDGLLEADAVEDAEDPVDLEAAGVDVAAVTPAEHAASDRPAAQATRASGA
jgi:hypothetical protein